MKKNLTAISIGHLEHVAAREVRVYVEANEKNLRAVVREIWPWSEKFDELERILIMVADARMAIGCRIEDAAYVARPGITLSGGEQDVIPLVRARLRDGTEAAEHLR